MVDVACLNWYRYLGYVSVPQLLRLGFEGKLANTPGSVSTKMYGRRDRSGSGLAVTRSDRHVDRKYQWIQMAHVTYTKTQQPTRDQLQ